MVREAARLNSLNCLNVAAGKPASSPRNPARALGSPVSNTKPFRPCLTKTSPAPQAFDLGALGRAGELGDRAFASIVVDPYLSNPIARASATMAELSAQRSAPVAIAAE